jgi:hypothetical protein
MKLVSAQSPDEMIEHLRDAMFSAGQSAETMNRQQLKILSTQTGLSAEVARSVFSIKNQGKSVEELKALQEGQESTQETQAKALKSLANDIKRLVKEMKPLGKSFVSVFVDGMKKGIMRSREFRKLMMSIRQGLMLTWREGFKLGKVLIKSVPAINQTVKALTEFFNPKKYQALAKKMRHIILDFLSGGDGVSNVLHRAQSAFTSFFSTQSPAVKGMIKGAKMIMTRISTVIAEGITWVTKQLVTGIKYIAGVISGKNTGIIGLASGVAGKTLGFLWDIIKPIIDSIIDAAPLILNALTDLLIVTWERLKKEANKQPIKGYIDAAATYLMYGFAIAVGSRVAIGAIVAGISQAIGTGLVAAATSSTVKKSITNAANSAMGQASKASNAVNKGSNLGSRTTNFLDGWVTAARKAGLLTTKQIGKLFLVITAIGGGLATSVALLGVGLRLALEALKPAIKNYKDVITLGVLLGGLILSTKVASDASSKINMKNLLTLGGVMLGIGTALSLGGVYLAKGIKSMVDELKGVNILDFIPFAAGIGIFLTTVAGLSITAAIISRIAKPDAIIKGGIIVGAMSLLLVGIIGLIGAVVYAMKKAQINSQDVFNVSKTMQSIATSMLIMVPVIAAAGLLGAVLMGPQAAVIGAAVGIGLSVIVGGIGAITAVAIGIMQTLSTIKFKSGIGKKVDIFTGLMSIIHKLVITLGSIVKEMSPGLIDLVSIIMGGKISDRIKSTTDFIGILIPSIQNLITHIYNVIETFGNVSSKVLIGGKILSSILSSVTQFMKYMTPPKELLGGSNAEIGLFSAKISQTTTTASNYIDKLKDSIQQFMTRIVELLNVISGLNITDSMMTKGIPAISKMLTGMAGLMRALVPDSKTISQFKEVEKSSMGTWLGGILSTSSKKEKSKVSNQLADFLKHTKDSFKNLIDVITGKDFISFLDKLSTVAMTEQHLKSLSAIGKIMSAVGKIMSSIAGLTSMGSAEVNISDVKKGASVVVNMPNPSEIINLLDKLSGKGGDVGAIQNLFNRITKMAGGLKLSSNEQVIDDIDVLKRVFSVIGQITGFVKTITSQATTMIGDNKSLDINKLIEPLTLLDEFLMKISTSDKNPISSIITNIGKLATLVGNSIQGGQLKTLRAIADQTSQVSRSVTLINKNIIEEGIVPALDAVRRMINATNEMNEKFNNISVGKIKVQTGLKKVAESMGVGGKANYTIRNKPINIHLAIQVDMKAAEVEKAIVFRKSSVIRDQLRWIRGSSLKPNEDAFNKNSMGDLSSSNSNSYVGRGGDFTSPQE